MNRNTMLVYPDYKAILAESHRFDCTITEADFNTCRPNPYRIDYIVSDINRYLKYKDGGRL